MYTDTYSREEMAKRIAEGRKFDNAVIISFYDTVGCEPLDYSGAFVNKKLSHCANKKVSQL
jgi:hypothetical protein